MELEYAKKLLETLPDGVKPMTRAILPETDSSNQVEIVRALHTALDALNHESITLAKTRSENAGNPWTKQDDTLLCCMFNDGCSKKEISNQFKRSHCGIAARLMILGKTSSRDEYELRVR